MSQESESSVVFHLGQYVATEQATVKVSSLAMRYGLSVFEGIRGYRQKDGRVLPFMLEEHLRRLQASLKLMYLADPGVGQIPGIINTLLELNGLDDDVYIRPSVHAINVGDLNIKPVTGMTVNISPMGRKKWLSEGMGVRATLSSIRKIPHDAFPSTAKCIAAYASSFIASTMAKASGFDVPLFLNHAGYLTEAPTAALFLVRGRVLTHPPATDGILPSVTAFVLRELAKQQGIMIAERHLRPEDVVTADEAFLCGTGLEVAPIESFDGHRIGSHVQRPVTKSLVDAYFALARGETTLEGGYYHI